MALDRSEIVEKYRNMYKSSTEFAKPIWDDRIRNFNLYVGNVTPKRYKSEANFHVPYCSTLLMNVLPLLTFQLQESKVTPRNSERDYRAALLMEKLLEYTFEVNKFDLTFINFVYAGMLHDTGWLKVGWDYQDSKTDHASITQPDSFDIYPHPRKTALDDNWPLFVYSEMTKAEMIAKGWDKRSIGSLGPSKLKTQTYRRQRLQALGMSIKEFEDGTKQKDDLYEVVEVWGKMDLTFNPSNPNPTLDMGYLVMANGEKLINLTPPRGGQLFESPYKHDKIPYAYFPYETIPNMLLGQGFVDPIALQQEELNALENMKADNYKRRNNPPLIVRRTGQVDLTTLRFVNSVPWLVNSEHDITQFEIPDLAESIANQQNMIKEVMQSRTGANDVLLVTNDAALKGGESATGAAIANENTKMRFKPIALRIDLAIERVGELLISLYQDDRYFDRSKALAIADQDGNNYPTEVKSSDVQGDLQFVVTSNSSIADSNDVKLQRAVNIKELYAQDPTVNQDELDEPIFDAAGYDFTKVKRSMQSMTGDAVSKLQQLVAVTQSPQFQSSDPAQKAMILTQIQQLRQMVGGQIGSPMSQGASNPAATVSAEAGPNG